MSFFKKSRKWTAVLFASVFSLSLVNCDAITGGDDDDDSALLLGLLALAGGGATSISGNITSDTTLASGSVINGTVRVQNGATLTIPAGATIFAGQNSSLFIEAGSQINAVGTASAPIVFTPSTIEGAQFPGDWGGIVLIGNATTNLDAAAQTEGPVDINYGLGTNDADSSGIMQYVRIEYGGDEVAVGDELNCLSMYAVGSGTTLDHIQCHMGRDDAFEWFGGSVNGKYLLATGTGDDDFDLDQGYHGKLQFLIAHKFKKVTGLISTDPRGLEWDGSDDGSAIPSGAEFGDFSTPVVANMTLIGSFGNAASSSDDDQHAAEFREGTKGILTHANGWGFDSDSAGDTSSSTVGNDAEWICDEGDGATATITFANIFTAGAAENDTGAAVSNCTVSNFVGSLTSATIATIGVAGGTNPDFTPASSVTNTGTNISTVDSRFQDDFFTDNDDAAGISPQDGDWTQGWTNYSVPNALFQD